MADTSPVHRPRRWLLGCGIAAGTVLLVSLLFVAGSFVLFRGKESPVIGSLSSEGGPTYYMGQGPSSPEPQAEMTMDEARGMTKAAPAESPGQVGGGEPLFTSVAAAAESRDIIYTATMTVEVDDVRESARSVEELIKSSGGWLGNKASTTTYEGNTSTTISMRVPATKFESVMEALRGLGDVRNENIDAQDVTKQMTDLEARLRNLRREEGVIADLFQRQGRIADVLEVERELSRVRGGIEQGESTLAGLRESVRYSTITVTINPKPSKVEQKLREWSAGYHVLNAWNALIKVVRALITALIYIAIVVGPFIVVALILWWAIRASRRAKTPGPGV